MDACTIVRYAQRVIGPNKQPQLWLHLYDREALKTCHHGQVLYSG